MLTLVDYTNVIIHAAFGDSELMKYYDIEYYDSELMKYYDNEYFQRLNRANP